jgi:hypothetical protein
MSTAHEFSLKFAKKVIRVAKIFLKKDVKKSKNSAFLD